MASYAVESQRYCNYSLDKFDSDVVFVKPVWAEQFADAIGANSVPEDKATKLRLQQWALTNESCLQAERNYFELLHLGAKPEEARAVLPNAAKCTVVWTANMREIRHFIKLRASTMADPSIRKLARQLLAWMRENGLGVLVSDIEVDDV